MNSSDVNEYFHELKSRDRSAINAGKTTFHLRNIILDYIKWRIQNRR